MKVVIRSVALLWALSLGAFAQEGMIVATGFGTVDPTMTKTNAQAKMLAKRAAQLDAQRQLSEQVKGIEIRAGSTVEDYEVKSDIIATRVKTWLQGGVVLDESVKMEEGTWVAEVKMGICLTNQSEQCKTRESLRSISNDASQL